MCGSMVGIQPPTTENRRGKEEERTTAAKYNGLPITMGGHTGVQRKKISLQFTNQSNKTRARTDDSTAAPL